MAGRRRSGFCRSIVAPEKEDEETVGRTVFRTMGRSFRLSDMISLARRWSCLMSVLLVFRPRAKSEERRAKSEEGSDLTEGIKSALSGALSPCLSGFPRTGRRHSGEPRGASHRPRPERRRRCSWVWTCPAVMKTRIGFACAFVHGMLLVGHAAFLRPIAPPSQPPAG